MSDASPRYDFHGKVILKYYRSNEPGEIKLAEIKFQHPSDRHKDVTISPYMERIYGKRKAFSAVHSTTFKIMIGWVHEDHIEEAAQVCRKPSAGPLDWYQREWAFTAFKELSDLYYFEFVRWEEFQAARETLKKDLPSGNSSLPHSQRAHYRQGRGARPEQKVALNPTQQLRRSFLVYLMKFERKFKDNFFHAPHPAPAPARPPPPAGRPPSSILSRRAFSCFTDCCKEGERVDLFRRQDSLNLSDYNLPEYPRPASLRPSRQTPHDRRYY